MVYVIAAYSITLGTLALYLVGLQGKARRYCGEIANAGGAAAPDARSGFNVGAMLLAPIWMMRHGLVLPGALLLAPCLALVPLFQQEMWMPMLFVAAIPLAAGAALGFVGNRIAVAHTGVHDLAAFTESQQPWAKAGIALHAFALPWAVYFGLS